MSSQEVAPYTRIRDFIASPNRERALSALSDRTEPATQRELATETDLSITAISRVLAIAEDHEWVRCCRDLPQRDAERFELTTTGQIVLYTLRAAIDDIGRESIEFLNGSTKRLKVLIKLSDEPRSQSELVKHMSASETSINRYLKAFSERGLVRFRNEGATTRYECTSKGRDILNRYDNLAETIEQVYEYRSVISTLGAIGLDVGPEIRNKSGSLTPFPVLALFEEETTIVTSKSADADAVLNYYGTLLEELTPNRIQAVSPVISTQYRQLHWPLLEQETNIEVIIDETVAAVAQTSYNELLTDALSHERASMYVHPERLQFGLALFDTRIAVFPYDENTGLRACITSTNESLLEWGDHAYNAVREASTLLRANGTSTNIEELEAGTENE